MRYCRDAHHAAVQLYVHHSLGLTISHERVAGWYLLAGRVLSVVEHVECHGSCRHTHGVRHLNGSALDGWHSATLTQHQRPAI